VDGLWITASARNARSVSLKASAHGRLGQRLERVDGDILDILEVPRPWSRSGSGGRGCERL